MGVRNDGTHILACHTDQLVCEHENKLEKNFPNIFSKKFFNRKIDFLVKCTLYHVFSEHC